MINYRDYINKIKNLTSNISNVGMNFYSLKQNIETLIKLLEEMLKENQGLKEELIKKDSHNSHLPPSKDKEKRYPNKKKKSKKKSGGQKGHWDNSGQS